MAFLCEVARSAKRPQRSAVACVSRFRLSTGIPGYSRLVHAACRFPRAALGDHEITRQIAERGGMRGGASCVLRKLAWRRQATALRCGLFALRATSQRNAKPSGVNELQKKTADALARRDLYIFKKDFESFISIKINLKTLSSARCKLVGSSWLSSLQPFAL